MLPQSVIYTRVSTVEQSTNFGQSTQALLESRIHCVCGAVNRYDPNRLTYGCPNIASRTEGRSCPLSDYLPQPVIDQFVWEVFTHFVLNRHRLAYELHRRKRDIETPSAPLFRNLSEFEDCVRRGLDAADNQIQSHLIDR